MTWAPSIIYSGENNTQVVIKTTSFLDNQQRGEVIDTLSETFQLTDGDILASEQFGTVCRE